MSPPVHHSVTQSINKRGITKTLVYYNNNKLIK